ncbi:MAG: hypothetical protein IJ623_06065 [Bacteroidales bacterium]|jgi:hypothetical protein|nr:hypothetical protein [Bacteroidales bacterium]
MKKAYIEPEAQVLFLNTETLVCASVTDITGGENLITDPIFDPWSTI